MRCADSLSQYSITLLYDVGIFIFTCTYFFVIFHRPLSAKRKYPAACQIRRIPDTYPYCPCSDKALTQNNRYCFVNSCEKNLALFRIHASFPLTLLSSSLTSPCSVFSVRDTPPHQNVIERTIPD